MTIHLSPFPASLAIGVRVRVRVTIRVRVRVRVRSMREGNASLVGSSMAHARAMAPVDARKAVPSYEFWTQ